MSPQQRLGQALSASAGISRHWSAFSLFVSEMKIVGRHWSALLPRICQHWSASVGISRRPPFPTVGKGCIMSDNVGKDPNRSKYNYLKMARRRRSTPGCFEMQVDIFGPICAIVIVQLIHLLSITFHPPKIWCSDSSLCSRCRRCRRKEIQLKGCTGSSNAVCTCREGYIYHPAKPCYKCPKVRPNPFKAPKLWFWRRANVGSAIYTGGINFSKKAP